MLATVLAIGAGAWVGGLVTVTLVVVSSRTMGAERVLLFRAFGRRFAVFFGITAVFVVAPAVTLALTRAQSLATTAALLAITLLVATGFGIVQARRMRVMRTALAAGSVSESLVQRNAALAATIRAILVVGYVALLVIAVLLSGGV